MTNHSPPPNNPTGAEPNPVDPVDELLSALTDGELAADELIELEEYAVENDQTLDQLTAPFHATQTQVSALLNEPAPSNLKSAHLAAALGAMDEPEVLSLAAARASQTAEAKKFHRSQKLNRRLRQLSAVAASFAVVAGIGVIALQGGSGSDDAESASGAATATTAAASAGEDATFMQADDGASDDEAMMEAESEAMEEGDVMEESEPTAPAAASDLAGTDAVELDPATALEDLTVEELTLGSELNRVDVLRQPTIDSTDSVCLQTAIEVGIDEALIQQGIVIEQNGILYELIVLTTEELRVFQLPECIQID